MIQRIQTIYLLTTSILVTILLFMSFWQNHLLLIIGVIMLASLGIITIFYFKNRNIQLKLSRVMIIMSVILLFGKIYIYLSHNQIELGTTGIIILIKSNWLDILIIIIAIICIALASRAITKDEELIKSMDRLR